MTEQPTMTNPYNGPSPFVIGQKLYGRETETKELTDLLLTARVALLHSPSGAGKTSLINAALIPSLLDYGFSVSGPVRVNHPPAPSTLETHKGVNRFVLSCLLGFSKVPESEVGVEQELALAQYNFDSFFQEKLSALEGQNLLVIFDQFEEVLNIDSYRVAEKEDFFTQLGKALKDRRIWALFAMREDYMGALAPYLAYLPDRLRARYRLDLLNEEAARKAIRLPADNAGGKFDPQAVKGLVDNLRRVIVRQGMDQDRSSLGPYIEPILLQVVCQWLWNRKTNSPDQPGYGEITQGDIDALPIDEALVAYYRGVVLKAARVGEATERALRDWIDAELVTSVGLRGQASEESLEKYGINEKAVRQLGDSYLIRKDTRVGRTWYELSHDRMVKPVTKDNETWRNTNLEQFQKDAIRWSRAGKTDDLLMSESDHITASNLFRANREKANALDEEYIRESYRYIQQADVRNANLHTNLEDLGWGIIFNAHDGPEAREALSELLEHRRRQAGKKSLKYYHEFTGEDGYRPGETARAFLTRHGVGWSKTGPEKMPYYLLIVGDPEQIPFEFQYGLDAQFAVGRIHFETIEEYRTYARSVVQCESETFSLPRTAAFFSPQNVDYPATKMMTTQFIRPVFDNFTAVFDEWDLKLIDAEKATKKELDGLINGSQPPSFLLIGGHTATFRLSDPETYEYADTGAFICQDWPGPKEWRKGGGVLQKEVYFSAADVSDEARLLGSIFFLMSGPSVGTPKFEDFNQQSFKETPEQLAPKPFLNRLPVRLLGHPNGSALGVIGHVERLWGYSWWTGRAGRDSGVMEAAMRRILMGDTLGAALDMLNQRYTAMAAWLSELLIQVRVKPESVDAIELANAFTAAIDARNYIILGDPAVHLSLAKTADAVDRRVLSAPEASAEEGPQAYFSGIDFTTGQYAYPDIPLEQLYRLIAGEQRNSDILASWPKQSEGN